MTFKLRDDKESEKPAVYTSVSPISSTSSSKVEAFLGKGSKIVGTLTFTGPVEIDGYVEGEINAQATLVIGESAVVSAKVIGAEVIVKGQVNGDIIATKRLSLKSPAKITGNISCQNLSMEEGVAFEGKCSMNVPKAQEKSSASEKSTVKVVGSEKMGATV